MKAILRRIDWPLAGLLAVAALLAVVGARPYAASFNDGSRLATIEALVDYRTLAIDHSIYVAPQSASANPKHEPYVRFINGWDNGLHDNGTLDKMLIRGHFYSDKPAVMAFALAGPYWIAQQMTGLRARERPDQFAYLMTLLSCGVPYVLAVAAVARTGRLVGLSRSLNLALTASFAFCTVAAAYTTFVNGHMPQLAVAALVFMLLADFPRDPAAPLPWGKLLLLGLLNGLSYAIEQPTGGLLLAGTGLVLLYRRPRVSTALLYGLAVLPFPIVHHAVGYSLAGTFAPLGQNPEYFKYEGSTFDAKDLTGNWNHDNLGWFLYYAAGLIYSHRGFLSSNVPLFLLVPGSLILLRRVRVERPEMWLAGLWCAGVWLVFATLSTNYAGSCCSIRWFVPLLAAGYYLLALLLRERPDLTPDFLLLSGWGLVLASEMWWEGTWAYAWESYWYVQVLAPLTWAIHRLRLWRAERLHSTRTAMV